MPTKPYPHIAVLIMCLLPCGCNTATLSSKGEADPSGRILVLSDGDMVATAYIDGQLGPVSPDGDRLTMLTANPDGLQQEWSVPAPNAVTGPALAVDVAHGTAFVIETSGPQAGATSLQTLPAGRRLTAIDLDDNGATRREIGLSATPLAVRVTSASDPIAVIATNEVFGIGTPAAGPALTLFAPNELENSQENLRTIAIDDTALPGAAEFGGAVSAELHPNGRIIAVLLRNLGERNDTNDWLVFFEWDGADTLVAWGEPVEVAPGAFNVHFTSDGRFALVNSVIDTSGALIIGTALSSNPLDPVLGRVVSVAVGEPGTPASQVQHRIVADIAVPIFPEGLVLSPDERFVAVASMQGTAVTDELAAMLPENNQALATESVLTVLSLGIDGSLQQVAQAVFDGILPESVAFDASGRFIAAVSFQSRSAPDEGRVDVWSFTPEAGVAALELLKSASVPRGAHVVKWLP